MDQEQSTSSEVRAIRREHREPEPLIVVPQRETSENLVEMDERPTYAEIASKALEQQAENSA